MQHLGVLTAAGGHCPSSAASDRIDYFNPVPLREWYERWVQPLADADSARLLAVKRKAEKPERVVRELSSRSVPCGWLTSCGSPPAPSGPSR